MKFYLVKLMVRVWFGCAPAKAIRATYFVPFGGGFAAEHTNHKSFKKTIVVWW